MPQIGVLFNEVLVPRLAFFTFAILRVKGFFDRVAANFAAAERCDGYIDRSELIPGTQARTWGEPVAPRFFREGEHGGAPHDHGPTAVAFHIKQAFGPDGRPVELDRARVKALVRKNAGAGGEP